MSLWRDRLRPASFRGVGFHVEIGARSGGRRPVLHEFPKRDTPYAEDMGRKGGGFTITAYVIGSAYTLDRDDLIEALETEGPGLLVHPTMGEFDAQPGPFSVVERRERGGFAEFEMNFLEAGSRDPFTITNATQGQVGSAADAAEAQVTNSTASQLAQAGPGQNWI